MEVSEIEKTVENAKKFKHLLLRNGFVKKFILHYEWVSGFELDSALHTCSESPLIAKKISSLTSIRDRCEIVFWILFFVVNVCIIATASHDLRNLISTFFVDIFLIYIFTVVHGRMTDTISRHKIRLRTLNTLYGLVEKLLTQWDPQTLINPEDVSRNLHHVAQAIMVLEESENKTGTITIIWDNSRKKRISLNNTEIHICLKEMVNVAFSLKLISTPKYDFLFENKPHVIDFCI